NISLWLILQFLGRSHNLRSIVADSSIHSSDILSPSIHSGKNVQASLNRDQNDNDITMEFNSIVIDVNSYQNQTFPSTTNSVQTNHPFELDKALPPKMATTLSDTHKIIQQNNRDTANLRSHLLFHGMKCYAFKSQEDQRNLQKYNIPVTSLSQQRKREIDEALL
ncbi:unnamed protein product, partial [Rotaria sordida]